MDKILVALMASMSLFCSAASAATCAPSGLYFRSHGEQLKVAPVVEESGNPPTAQFELMTLGRMVMGAPTVGTAEGKIQLSRDYCVGVYSAEPESCTLVYNFSSKSVKIRQIDHCYFGAGASADGRFTKRAKQLPGNVTHATGN